MASKTSSPRKSKPVLDEVNSVWAVQLIPFDVSSDGTEPQDISHDWEPLQIIQSDDGTDLLLVRRKI